VVDEHRSAFNGLFGRERAGRVELNLERELHAITSSGRAGVEGIELLITVSSKSPT
jgi:hypothetical protein